ncbi:MULTISPECIES: metallophosphoesterase [unclassified Bradyrhizobium]|uniref:metallophosphoesterase n=1 Tax=unclassified Bradyrhizobium TaxID=2631580 RepID=UPI001FF8B2CB|nr:MULTISPECIES: metallophosphoesterase [unclassified Bradyrhizobium]MCK1540358.1 metallophosphoesterase [Bradyrhizobium sp. 176]MCK1556200.1 metallophosphoesterase [Bradyrhizobium sp. 171]
MTTWLYSDPHFGHASPDKPDGIIRMCGRPFANGREMTETMVRNWVKCVRAEDDIIVLGDFAHRMPLDDLRKLFARLPGRKHLIAGNHDTKQSGTLDLAWNSIRDISFTTIDSQRVVLCHYALRTWPGIRKGALMLYGHSHGKLPGNSQSCDIGVDVMGYAPLRLNQIKAHLATLPPLVDPQGGDDLENNDGVQP